MLNRVSRRCFCTAAAAPAPTTLSPWLFVGLGNPGEKFKGTRHNVGFEMIDAFAESLGISMNIPLCKALFGEGFVGDAPVLLAKPQTYMNLSGESAGPLAAYYKLPLNRVIVFHDDMELPCGVLRLQEKGGHGCHRGYGPWSLVYLFPGLEFADSCVKNVRFLTERACLRSIEMLDEHYVSATSKNSIKNEMMDRVSWSDKAMPCVHLK